MKLKSLWLAIAVLLTIAGTKQALYAQLNNPMSVSYLKEHLRKESPKLILTSQAAERLRQHVKTNSIVKNLYEAVRLNAQQILEQPLLEYKKQGRRLRPATIEMFYRMNILCIMYVVDQDPGILNRINEEITRVCRFPDWNPDHFLDVVQLAMAVAIGLDWTEGHLPAATIALAKNTLIEKAIKPSFEANAASRFTATNNWNQVCNGGIIAAAIMIADIDPELAAKTIHRSLNGMPNALKEYGPDGVYPEGPGYWSYGTAFTALTASSLQSAFGTDFGISAYKPFMATADFELLCKAPSGLYFNFFDCGDKEPANGNLAFSWFAYKTGNENYIQRDKFLKKPESMGKLERYMGAALIWLSEFQKKDNTPVPENWQGNGDNPVVFFRGDKDDTRGFYFAAKGGKANISHGNMDAGSFVFELDGVRWVADPGIQDYNELEKQGFDLWGMCQTCDRWKLLTKNNFGHSTLTVNDELFDINGFAPITGFTNGPHPEATVDLTSLYNGKLKNATRSFTKENNSSLLIKDQFTVTDSTQTVTWQLITTAKVEIIKSGAILRKGGKQLKLEILSDPRLSVTTISLDPPPLKTDKKIAGLKRLEIKMPARLFNGTTNAITVRLSN